MAIVGPMGPISPELVLVDDALGRSARAALHDPLPTPTATASSALQQGSISGDIVRRQRVGYAEAVASGRQFRLGKLLVILLAFGVLCVPLAGNPVGRPAGGRSVRAQLAADTSAAVVHPVRRTAVKNAPRKPHRGGELRWRPVRGAAFYNVILWRNGARALDLWPRQAQIKLSVRSLPPGEYRWFTYPAMATKRGVRYGRLVAQGTLTLSGYRRPR